MNRQVKATVAEFSNLQTSQSTHLLKIEEVLAIVRDTRSSFYRRHPLAKRRIKVGRNSFWSKQVVEEWITQQAANNAA